MQNSFRPSPKPISSDIQQWFDDPLTWEIPHQTIRYDYSQLLQHPNILWYYNQRIMECSIEIEKRIIFRCLPYHPKRVNHLSKLYAAQLHPSLWNYLIHILSFSCVPTKKSISKICLPDHGFRRIETNEKVTWIGNLPRLYNINWHYKKWIDLDTYNLWRAKVTELHLIYNSYTHLVRVEFAYDTELWDDDNKTWYLV